jgi:hypothetical protein
MGMCVCTYVLGVCARERVRCWRAIQLETSVWFVCGKDLWKAHTRPATADGEKGNGR